MEHLNVLAVWVTKVEALRDFMVACDHYAHITLYQMVVELPQLLGRLHLKGEVVPPQPGSIRAGVHRRYSVGGFARAQEGSHPRVPGW